MLHCRLLCCVFPASRICLAEIMERNSPICFTYHQPGDTIEHMMKHALMALAAICTLGTVAYSQPLLQMLEQIQSPQTAALTPDQRAARFSALAALPADTDSFFALAGLGQMARSVQGADSDAGQMAAAMVTELDGFAMGMSQAAVQDLQRLLPLWQVSMLSFSDWMEEWSSKAAPDAALAIVAQGREQEQKLGETLVQATRDFHLAPIQLVLSCKPGGQNLLHQLSVLPLMAPVEPDGPVSLVAHGACRGFCLRGDKLDLDELELAPEHESQIKENLKKVNLYLLAQVQGNYLVVTLCSNPDEIPPMPALADSVLATARMQEFDAELVREPMMLGYSSPAAVNLRDELNMIPYYAVPRDLALIFSRLVDARASMAPAVAAIEQMLSQVAALVPRKDTAERFVAWKQDSAYYLRMSGDACGHAFEAGSFSQLQELRNPDTAIFAESTGVKGMPQVDFPALMNNVQLVQQAYLDTLTAEHAATRAAELAELQQLRPVADKAVAALNSARLAEGGSVSVLLRGKGSSATPGVPVSFSIRADVADPAAIRTGVEQFRQSVQTLTQADSPASCPIEVQTGERCILFTSDEQGLPLSSSQPPVQVRGGALFSLNLPALATALDDAARVSASKDLQQSAASIKEISASLQMVEGVMTTRDDQVHTLIRFTPAQ